MLDSAAWRRPGAPQRTNRHWVGRAGCPATGPRWSSTYCGTALAAHGDLARHLRRLRRELAARRAAVVAALRGAGHDMLGESAGAHLIVPLPDSGRERTVVAAAAAAGLGLDSLARHHAGPPRAFGLAIGYAELDGALAVVLSALH